MKEGTKYDNQKRDWTLLPFDEVEDVVEILEFGALKYARDNWKKVLPSERYTKAALRHLIAYTKGEQFDDETGKSHLAHACCCMLFKMWHDKHEQENHLNDIVDNHMSEKMKNENILKLIELCDIKPNNKEEAELDDLFDDTSRCLS